MIPHELTPRKIKLPETNNHSIVLITEDRPRHQRFAYRIQKEFGDLVLAWYHLGTASDFVHPMSIKGGLPALYQKVKNRLLTDYKAEEINYYIRNKGLRKSIKKMFFLIYTMITDAYLLQKRR
ncbi:unnamed protein product, partial [marine sediment metagenome]